MNKKELFFNLIDLCREYYNKKKDLKNNLSILDDKIFKNLQNNVLNQKAVFVLSTGRCGTFTLTKSLRLDKQFMVRHSPEPELSFMSKYIYDNKLINSDNDNLNIAFMFSRFDLLQEAFLRNKIYIETNNKITFLAPSIKKLMPNSYFIILFRDPIKFLNSAYKRGYYQKHRYDIGHITPNIEKYANTLEDKILCNWLETNKFIINFMQSLEKNRFLIMDITKYTPKGLGAIYNLLNIPYLDNSKTYSILNKKHNVTDKNIYYTDYSKISEKLSEIVKTLYNELLNEEKNNIFYK